MLEDSVDTARSDAAPTRRARGSLSAAKIVDGAFEFASEHTVDGISMPKLARHLDVGVTSIYWYFKSKEELLDALTTEAMKRFYERLPTFTSLRWDLAMLEHFRAFRHIFQTDDVLCDLILLRGAQFHSQRSLAAWRPRQEEYMSGMVKDGFTHREAADAYFSLSVYVRGAIIIERLLLVGDHPRPHPLTVEDANAINPATYPHTHKAALEHSFTGVNDEEFDRGLIAFIQGIRTSRES